VSTQAKQTDELVITDPDKGRSIELSEGQVLEVRLESLPTTGYKWSLDSDSTEKLKLIDQTETKPETPGYGANEHVTTSKHAHWVGIHDRLQYCFRAADTNVIRHRIGRGEVKGPRILTVGEPIYIKGFLEANHISMPY